MYNKQSRTKTTLTGTQITQVRKQLRAIYNTHIENNDMLGYKFITDLDVDLGFAIAFAFKNNVTQTQQDECVRQWVNLFSGVERVIGVAVQTVNAPYQIGIEVTY